MIDFNLVPAAAVLPVDFHQVAQADLGQADPLPPMPTK